MLRMIQESALSIPRIKTEKGKVKRVSQQAQRVEANKFESTFKDQATSGEGGGETDKEKAKESWRGNAAPRGQQREMIFVLSERKPCLETRKAEEVKGAWLESLSGQGFC